MLRLPLRGEDYAISSLELLLEKLSRLKPGQTGASRGWRKRKFRSETNFAGTAEPDEFSPADLVD
jgi:hypothetical protein